MKDPDIILAIRLEWKEQETQRRWTVRQNRDSGHTGSHRFSNYKVESLYGSDDKASRSLSAPVPHQVIYQQWLGFTRRRLFPDHIFYLLHKTLEDNQRSKETRPWEGRPRECTYLVISEPRSSSLLYKEIISYTCIYISVSLENPSTYTRSCTDLNILARISSRRLW